MDQNKTISEELWYFRFSLSGNRTTNNANPTTLEYGLAVIKSFSIEYKMINENYLTV